MKPTQTIPIRTLDLRAALAACGALLALCGTGELAHAACGVTDITWGPPGGQTGWNQSAAWIGSNIPNASTENAIIVSGKATPNSNLTATIGCLDVQSGFLNTTTGI